MRNIVIYGAGGFGRETSLLIEQINSRSTCWSLIGYCDDAKKPGEKVDNLPILGGVSYLSSYQEELDVVVAIADPTIRAKLIGQLINPVLRFPSVIHPSVFINEGCEIEEGSIICAGVIMTVVVRIKSFSIVNLCCTLGHDCVLGNFSSLMPAVNISGNVVVGNGVYIGAGAILLQGVSIGDGCVVGAGSVVTKSFENNRRIIGIPARGM